MGLAVIISPLGGAKGVWDMRNWFCKGTNLRQTSSETCFFMERLSIQLACERLSIQLACVYYPAVRGKEN